MGHVWGPADEGDTRRRPAILPFTGACRRCKTRLETDKTWIASVHWDGEQPKYARLCEACAKLIHDAIWHYEP